jgi:hypothetical protein
MKVVKRNYFNAEGNLIIKPYQLQHLGEIYEVHPRTVRRWIDKLAPQIGRKKVKYFTIEEVVIIVNAIGLPQIIELKKAA